MDFQYKVKGDKLVDLQQVEIIVLSLSAKTNDIVRVYKSNNFKGFLNKGIGKMNMHDGSHIFYEKTRFGNLRNV